MLSVFMKRSRIVAGLALVLALGAAYWLLRDSALLMALLDSQALKSFVDGLGAGLVAGEADQALIAALGLGVLVALPLAFRFLRERLKARSGT
jgi:hypothetical protein